MGVTIANLPASASADRLARIPVMKDGVTSYYTVGQILDILIGAAPGQLDTIEELAAALGDDENFAATVTSSLASKADAAATTAALALKQDKALLCFGQCRMVLDGANLRLNRENGRLLTINGNQEAIPSGGVALAASGLTPSTLYYIYAYMNAGTMTLEASTTAPATDATTGIKIKAGDATRSLVGKARPVTGPAWVDSATQCFVLSYYNRVKKVIKNGFTISRSTTSTSFVEVNSEIRAEFLSWGDSASYFNTDGTFYNSTTGGAVTARLSLDGTSDIIAETLSALQSGYTTPLPLVASRVVSAGYHYATIAAKTSSGNAQFPGAAGDAGIHIFVTTEG